jgi:hypothetical protein
LVKKFVNKFEEVVSNYQQAPQESINRKLLEKMTYTQLCEYATDEEIDVEGLNSKKEVLKAIVETQELQSV